MTLPNFLIIGAAKSGTTALYYYLNQHPEIYMSPLKEPRFFAFENEALHPDHPIHRKTITNFESYTALFDGVLNEKAIGEASPAYLVEPKAPERIQDYIPDAKLIAILRNPAERAHSHFLHLIKYNHEPCHDFMQALENIDEICIGNWVVRRDYLQFGFYYAQLKRYYEKFNRNQIKVFLFEDLQSDSLALLQTIFSFLEIDESFTPNVSVKHSVSGIPKYRTLYNLLSKPNLFKALITPLLKPFFPQHVRESLRMSLINRNLHKPQLHLEVQSQLTKLYREDILNLQELIQRDLSRWLE